MKLKHVTLSLCAALLCAHSFAQPQLTDQGVVGGSLNDQFTSMNLTTDGGLIVGGFSMSNASAQKTEDRRGGNDFWIVKLDNKGSKQWDKTIGGDRNDFMRVVQQTADGGYIIGGESLSDQYGEKSQNSRGSNDYWIVKLDAAGIVEWDRTLGGTSFDNLSSLQQTIDGGYIAGGTSRSNISGEKTENNKGSDDFWIIKLDNTGTIEWDKTIGGGDGDMLQALQQTADGGYILGGYSSSPASGDKTSGNKGGADYWIVKLNATGAIEWDKTIGATLNESLSALQQTADGGYILGGYSSSPASGDKTEGSKGMDDFWIVKIDELGNVQWDKTIGGNDQDRLLAVRQTIDGGYILSGETNSGMSGDKTETSRGSYDYWVVKTNSNGKVQWDKTIGGSNYDDHCKVLEVKRNLYVLCGSSFSTVSGDKTGGNRGGNTETRDYWILKLRYTKPPVALAANPENTIARKAASTINPTSTFTAAPNPARDRLTIRAAGSATFTLTNATGKTVATQTVNGTGVMQVAHLPAGMYYLKNTATGTTQKIIIQK